ncbi:MAG: PD-(D/E)XK nuclease family protein [Rhizobacter sp.]|nr:PD-(D/E)XK nuclease family protein [Rhizobacter sp.]
MAVIARLALENGAGWADIAARISEWAGARAVARQALVVLVPFAQQLAPARAAFARLGGWQPRVETTRTMAASIGPAPRGGEGQISFDAATDRLDAARLLRGQSWVPRDPLAFDDAVSAVVTTAHAVLKAAAAVEPAARAEHWQRGRELIAPVAGVGAIERALARVALEWAAASAPPITDVLYACRPGAWVVVQSGGEDALARSVMSSMPDTVPCLLLDVDAHVHEALAPSIAMARCEGFEHEAVCAAAQVLEHLRRGEVPVALVAQDRLLMRRVRALLERQGVGLQDETGWKLSTTRAAAQVMALLRAAAPQASNDLLLDWLKTTAWPQSAVAQIEAACRREGWTQLRAIDADLLRGRAVPLLAEATALLQTFASARRQTLSEWLRILREGLSSSAVLAPMLADDAGAQVLQTLHIEEPAAWSTQAAQTSMSLAEFSAWVDAALEDASFIPQAAHDASVVLTPLARLTLRPFAAVVFPGADDHHLGVDAGPHPLLNEAQAEALGVPTARQRRRAESLAFAHAVSRAPVTFFHRHADGAEPLAPSPLLEQLGLRLASVGRTLEPWADPRLTVRLTPNPVTMPAPSAAALLPARLSASACEALRACPYRFHALYLLRVREAEELDDEVEQRDYGNWLHDVLLKFHTQRGEPAPAEVEAARLLAIAQEEKAQKGLDDADFLPFEAGFIDLVPRYIAWLHERDAQGARFWQGEQEREIAPAEWQGIRLYGRIDRMDEVRGPALELIDYKTGSAAGLKEKLRQPLEDTQLAFYAALVQPETQHPIHASYLALGRKIESLPHPGVEDSASALVTGVGADLARIRQGAGLPALGEAPTCDFCEARGLCRRDHWSGA